MKLKFPPLSGGITQGLNDAGIETFEGDYAHYVVRECAQNSLDAAASTHEPVEMEIAMRFLPADKLPFIDELRDTLDQCRVFWREDEKASEFFDRAFRLAKAKDIALLRISDFGTTGVPGGDEEMNRPWFGLVRSRGVSVKNDSASAGAFGIGKDAPLAASNFRTVIYSTRTQEGAVALQGICRLATHNDDDNSSTQGTGFIGNYSKSSGRFSALRTELEIPTIFYREKPGLDVWVVGFQSDVGDWEDPFIGAALRNFWPAIHFERLKLRVGQHDINRQTLPRLMERFRKDDDSVKEAYPYFQAVVGTGSHLREQELDTLDPKEGDGERTGGRVNRTGNDGENTGEATNPRVHIDLRSYSDGQGLGSYHLVLRASDTHAGDLRIDAVTEDGAPISCPLSAAYDEKGKPITVAGNRIADVQIPADGLLRLRVVLQQPMRVALRASTV